MKSKSIGMGSSKTKAGWYDPDKNFAYADDYGEAFIGSMDIDYHELIHEENKHLSKKVKITTTIAAVSLLTLCGWLLIRKQRH